MLDISIYIHLPPVTPLVMIHYAGKSKLVSDERTVSKETKQVPIIFICLHSVYLYGRKVECLLLT